MALKPIRISDDPETQLRDIRNAVNDLSETLDFLGGAEGGMQTLARVVGGIYVEGEVKASQAKDGGDTEVEVPDGPVRSGIMLSMDLEAGGGAVLGLPGGKRGTSGANESAWTRTAVFVRATRDSTYRFIII